MDMYIYSDVGFLCCLH